MSIPKVPFFCSCNISTVNACNYLLNYSAFPSRVWAPQQGLIPFSLPVSSQAYNGCPINWASSKASSSAYLGMFITWSFIQLNLWLVQFLKVLLFRHSIMCDSVAPRTVARQAPLSIRFPKQEYWSGLPFPSPEDLHDPGTEPTYPAWQMDSLPLSHLQSPPECAIHWQKKV